MELTNTQPTCRMLQTFPVRHLNAIRSRLFEDLNQLNLDEVTPEIEAKMDVEVGNEMPLEDMTVLPYHRIPEAMHAFVEEAKKEEFYALDPGELEQARTKLLKTLDAVARAVHKSKRGREMAEEMAEKETSGLKKRVRE